MTIVMKDSPEAATLQTVTGWVSRLGHFYGKDESAARWDGCTHVKCSACGEPAEKSWTMCKACRDEKALKAFEALPSSSWDGFGTIYSDALGKYYSDIGSIEDDVEEGGSLEPLRLLLCEAIRPRHVDIENLCEDRLPDDGDNVELPIELMNAVDALNKVIDTMEPTAYVPAKVRLALDEEGQAILA